MLHSDVKQRDRERIFRDFKSGRVLKIVATNIAARGLDFPNIELVIQLQPPDNLETYIHRAGRTGRAGKKGVSVLLVRKRDVTTFNKLSKEGRLDFEELVEKDLEKTFSLF
jgi:ATP-dependent RNA helicase DDX21